MKHEIPMIFFSNGEQTLQDVELSPSCPICKVSLLPKILYGIVLDITDTEEGDVYLLNYCPNCNKCFLSHHKITLDDDYGYSFVSAVPNLPVTTDWGNIISEVSPNFVEIYNQASAAESLGLSQISGVGYRKALEFLIKDYLISQTTDPAVIHNIKNKLLGSCIREDIDNPQLKTVASRAAWLGNDQTHYEQRFDDKDISDLKRLIRLTVHWISLLKETEEAESIEPRR